MSRPALVVGAGGLLGAAVRRSAHAAGRELRTAVVPWGQDDAADAVIAAAHDAGTRWGDDWDLLWCAGAAVAGASAEAFAQEIATFERCVDGLVASDVARPSQFFLASSAGGVYAGVDGAPFTEDSPTIPLAPYGHAKLELERVARRLSDGGSRVLVGRISNLYGPGQNLAKEQGLISRLCRSYLTRDPARIYVSLDTIRDYLYVDDCATLVQDAVDRLHGEPPGSYVVKILASQQSATIASLLGYCRQVFGPRVPVTLGASPLAKQQARDLRFRSVVWTELDERELTTLVHGIHSTAMDLRHLLVASRP